jgi:hypothetical protein
VHHRSFSHATQNVSNHSNHSNHSNPSHGFPTAAAPFSTSYNGAATAGAGGGGMQRTGGDFYRKNRWGPGGASEGRAGGGREEGAGEVGMRWQGRCGGGRAASIS